MYKNTLYLVSELTALTAAAARITASADSADGFDIAAVLAFCCLFLAEFLAEEIMRKKDGRIKSALRAAMAAAGILGCMVCGAGEYFPVLAALLFKLTDALDAGGYSYGIFAAAAVLSAMILEPPAYCAAAAGTVSAMEIFSGIIVGKLEHYKKISVEQRETIASLNARIAGLKSYSKAIRESAALEERGRFSARIHDRLGHGISGSIILLEGARLSIRTDPEQAERCLETAAENLRGSVDSIREALREERPARHAAGMAEINEALEKFSVTYEIKTDFAVEGDAEKIAPQIWICLKENLTEAMTNTVKHSEADSFSFKIFVYNKIIKAEFSDNGRSGGDFKKGMGLEAMEERTADCGGSCVFPKNAGGFKILNIFRL
ncbi:MAG: histidine kinase [Prevotella sp.]|nr:histidine kinase [Prevotella sp.]